MKRLQDKVAVVTGSTSGIGRAIALEFATQGGKVVVSGRNQERGDQVVQEIKDRGSEGIFVPIDLLDEDSLRSLIVKAVSHFGQLDILVNNAGKGFSKLFPEVTTQEWRDVMEADLTSNFITIQEAMPHLIKTKGNIINLSSGVVIKPQIGGQAYAAAKAGVLLLTQSTAREFAPKGVRVNAILPGLVDTPILDKYPDHEIQALADATPLGRIGKPEDIAMLAVYLASDEASFVTGQGIVIDGGVTI